MMTVYMTNARPSDDFSTVQWDGYRHDFALLVCVGWTAVCCLGGEVLSSAVATATSNSSPGIRARHTLKFVKLAMDVAWDLGCCCRVN